jgi:hypothetical protein
MTFTAAGPRSTVGDGTDAMRLVAFMMAALALGYSDLEAASLLQARLLPLLGILSLAYVAWFGGFAAIITGAAAWHFMEVFSPSLFKAVVLPMVLGLSVIWLAIWSGARGGWYEAGVGDSGDNGDAGSCDGGGD